jgi:hypothetical protein
MRAGKCVNYFVRNYTFDTSRPKSQGFGECSPVQFQLILTNIQPSCQPLSDVLFPFSPISNSVQGVA